MSAHDRDRWYPSPPPPLDDESDDAYTDRLTGADRTGRVPYDHPRNRQCSIGWHRECSDPAGLDCKCPCHSDALTSEQAAALQPAGLEAAAKLAGLYGLPLATGERVMLIAASRIERPGLPDPAIRGGIAVDLAAAYQSRTGNSFLTDVLNIYRAAAAGKLG